MLCVRVCVWLRYNLVWSKINCIQLNGNNDHFNGSAWFTYIWTRSRIHSTYIQTYMNWTYAYIDNIPRTSATPFFFFSSFVLCQKNFKHNSFDAINMVKYGITTKTKGGKMDGDNLLSNESYAWKIHDECMCVCACTMYIITHSIRLIICLHRLFSHYNLSNLK